MWNLLTSSLVPAEDNGPRRERDQYPRQRGQAHVEVGQVTDS